MGRGWFDSEDEFRRRMGLEARAPETASADCPDGAPFAWGRGLASIALPLLGGYVFVAFVIGLFDFDLGVTVMTRPVTWLVELIT
jgi:hypothetical protein